METNIKYDTLKKNILTLYLLLLEISIVVVFLINTNEVNVKNILVVLADIHIIIQLFSIYNKITSAKQIVIFILSLTIVFISLVLIYFHLVNKNILFHNISIITSVLYMFALKYYIFRYINKKND